ncbi:MAG: MFS transporter [Flavobacteriaceae bacterium]
MKPKPHILPVIIVAQFACTSLWFAGNAIIEPLMLKTGLGQEIMGYVLSSVQLGFISGTLVFALLMVADRYSPSRVFMICALLASMFNFMLLSDSISKGLLIVARFGTGFFLAGIYPVGMKIAADYYEKGLGKALGFLVGALVLGSAFPFLVKGLAWGQDQNTVIVTTSGLAILGGLILWILVPNGPYRRPSTKLVLRAGPDLFKIIGFRKVAFGYFGHMWELYAFWAFTPFAIQAYNDIHQSTLPLAMTTFAIIAMGSVSCILGGLLSQKYGSRKVAWISLALSGSFCLASPFIFWLAAPLFIAAWVIWGMAVIADSPQFSSLVAGSVPLHLKGTALTLVNCIGFGISIVSIQLLSFLSDRMNPNYLFLLLVLGPVLGLIGLKTKTP